MQPMQNRCKTARLADLVVAPSTSLSSTANHVSIPITGAPTDQRTAHCKEENKGKEKREECDLQLIRPASRHCALIVHSRCILVTLCVILCVFTQLILSHFDLEGTFLFFVTSSAQLLRNYTYLQNSCEIMFVMNE